MLTAEMSHIERGTEVQLPITKDKIYMCLIAICSHHDHDDHIQIVIYN